MSASRLQPLPTDGFASPEAFEAALDNMQNSWTLSQHTASVTSLAVVGRLLFSAAWDRQIHLYDIEQLPPRQLAIYQSERAAIAIAATASYVFAAMGGAEVETISWSASEQMFLEMVTPLRGHTRAVTALAVCDNLLYSSANDLTVRLWDASTLRQLAVLAEGTPPFGSLSVAGDVILATAHAGGGCVSVWRFSQMAVKAREWCALPPLLAGLADRLSLASLSGRAASPGPDGGAADGGAAAQSVAVSRDLDCVHSFVENGNLFRCVVHAGAGSGAALSASTSGEVQVWDVARQRKAAEWQFDHFGHDAPVTALAVCGDRVITASSDLTLRIARCAPPDAAFRRKGAVQIEPDEIAAAVAAGGGAAAATGGLDDEKAQAAAEAILKDLDRRASVSTVFKNVLDEGG